jgi:hypothetical protein
MKKSRLLEIIREEISTALSEITMVDKKTDATEAPEISKKEEKDLSTVQAAIKTAKTTGKPVSVAEEDLNEIPDFGGRFDKQVADKYGEEDTLETAMEKVVNRTLSDRGISKADVSKMDKEGLKGLLKAIRQQISGKGQVPDVAQALKKQTEFDDSGSKLQDNQTNNAILKALGLKEPGQRGRKADPNKPEKPASTGKKGRPAGEPKAKVATRTPGDDGFDKVEYSDVDGEDKEATQNIGSDSTAKELGTLATGKEDTFNRILGLVTKYKDDKAKVDAFISKAENEYKLPASLLKQLKLAAGRDVEI